MHRAVRRAVSGTAALIVLLVGCSAHPKDDDALRRIRARGYLECGVRADADGFSLRDASGNYSGLETDVCRAVAIAILGSPSVRFVAIDTLTQFRQQQDIDVVLHGLTQSYDRSLASSFQFSPAYFYDGQAFMRLRAGPPAGELTLADGTLCIASTARALRLVEHEFAGRRAPLHVMTVDDPEQALSALLTGACSAMTADVSVLVGLVLSHPQYAAKLEILPKRLSKEPLCALTRRQHGDLSAVVQWTIYALVEADELGITSANVKQMATDTRPEIADFLHLDGARGYGQEPDWAARVIEQVGNYAELYDRSVGSATVAQLPRGQNEIWERGGLLHSPPFSLR